MQIGGVGVGGLKYLNGAEAVDEMKRRDYLRSNVETLKNGLGFYLRDDEGNYLLLIRKDEVLSVMFQKDLDVIKTRSSFSLFQKCLDRGIPYHYARLMLMEDEIVTLHKPTLKIITTSLDEINFECVKLNPLKVRDFFVKSPWSNSLDIDYQTYTKA